VGGGEWGVTLKFVGREILSVVKLGGEKWGVGRGVGVGGRAVPFLPIPTRTLLEGRFLSHPRHGIVFAAPNARAL
jgi:hypothetical protein